MDFIKDDKDYRNNGGNRDGKLNMVIEFPNGIKVFNNDKIYLCQIPDIEGKLALVKYFYFKGYTEYNGYYPFIQDIYDEVVLTLKLFFSLSSIPSSPPVGIIESINEEIERRNKIEGNSQFVRFNRYDILIMSILLGIGGQVKDITLTKIVGLCLLNTQDVINYFQAEGVTFQNGTTLIPSQINLPSSLMLMYKDGKIITPKTSVELMTKASVPKEVLAIKDFKDVDRFSLIGIRNVYIPNDLNLVQYIPNYTFMGYKESGMTAESAGDYRFATQLMKKLNLDPNFIVSKTLGCFEISLYGYVSSIGNKDNYYMLLYIEDIDQFKQIQGNEIYFIVKSYSLTDFDFNSYSCEAYNTNLLAINLNKYLKVKGK